MKKVLILIIVGVVVVLVLVSRGGEPSEVTESEDVMMDEGEEHMDDGEMTEEEQDPALNVPVPGSDDAGEEVVELAGEVREFTIEGKNFEFSQDAISVNKGDTVRIVFTNVDGFHDWRIEGYDTGTSRISTGQTEVVEFVADREGSFEYFCSVGNHRALGMKGTLTVEAR